MDRSMEHFNSSLSHLQFGEGNERSIPYVVILTIFAVSVITINIKVTYSYCFTKRHMLRILHNRFLVSLSLGDMQAGIALGWTAACHYHQVNDRIYRVLNDMYTTFIVQATAMHLCAITIDRYLSLFFALRYRAIVTKNGVHFLIAISWGLPLTVSLVTFGWLHRIFSFPKSTSEIDMQHLEMWYSIISFVVFVAIPMIVLGIAFVQMFAEIIRLLKSTPRHHRVLGISPDKRKLIYIFCAMYTTFTFLVMPYFSLRLWSDVVHSTKDKWIISASQLFGERMAILLKALVSILNPLLYTSSSPELSLISKQARKKISLTSSFRKWNRPRCTSKNDNQNPELRTLKEELNDTKL